MYRDNVNIREALYDQNYDLLAASEDSNVIGLVEVIACSADGKRKLFTKTIRKNELLVTGSVFMMEKNNGFRSKFATTPIDVELGVHAASEVNTSSAMIPNEIVCGIMVGNGGAGDTINTVRKVNRAARMVPGPLPIRVVPATTDLNATERDKYILRKPRGEYIYYYGKRFDNTPVMSVMYEDGTVVPTNVGDLTSNNKFIRAYTTYTATLNRYDIREYHKITQGSTIKSFVNSVGLITGYPGVAADGKIEYFNVRGMTTLNMENRELKDSESWITFIYRQFIQ